MERYVGIWIDHRQAAIVTIRNREATTHTIYSGADSRARITGGSHTAGSGIPDGVPESRRDGRIAHQLDKFYEAVMETVRGAARIRVCGPGEARVELQKKIAADHDMGPRLEAVEPCDRITMARFIARVKKEYGVPVARAARA